MEREWIWLPRQRRSLRNIGRSFAVSGRRTRATDRLFCYFGRLVWRQRAHAEDTAKVVAFVVGGTVGLNTADAGRDDSHLYRGDREALAASLNRIQRAASMILTAARRGHIVPDRTHSRPHQCHGLVL
jgi:hypothetical protein